MDELDNPNNNQIETPELNQFEAPDADQFESSNTNRVRFAMLLSVAGIALFVLTILFVPFFRETLFDRLFPKDPSDAFIPDNDSGWVECNGWATDPDYNKYDCRAKALERAQQHNFYRLGLPLPPSGITEKQNGVYTAEATAGDDLAWFEWGGVDGVRPNGETVNFLSEGTQCGIGPGVCVPTPTPISTPEPTPSLESTPSLEPTITPTASPTPTVTSQPSPSPTISIPTPTLSPEPDKACLGDRVVLDTIRNNTQDISENGVAGVTVKLYSSANIIIATTVTNNQGYYEFCGLDAGEYSVTFEKPDIYSFAEKAVGTSTTDSDADPNSGITETVSLAFGQSRTDIDAILYSVCSSVGDYVFLDADQDGIQDANEPGIAGITVHLHTVGGTVLASATTDSNGYYDFGCVDAGAYYISFELPDGYVFSAANNGTDDSLDCDADPLTGTTSTIVLGEDDIQDTWDACVYVLGADTSEPLPNTGTFQDTLAMIALAGTMAFVGRYLYREQKHTTDR